LIAGQHSVARRPDDKPSRPPTARISNYDDASAAGPASTAEGKAGIPQPCAEGPDPCEHPPKALAHISPAHSENVNFFGTIDVDIESELAKLDGTGYWPLREAETLS
jgi:hypothetical protein